MQVNRVFSMSSLHVPWLSKFKVTEVPLLCSEVLPMLTCYVFRLFTVRFLPVQSLFARNRHKVEIVENM